MEKKCLLDWIVLSRVRDVKLVHWSWWMVQGLKGLYIWYGHWAKCSTCPDRSSLYEILLIPCNVCKTATRNSYTSSSVSIKASRQFKTDVRWAEKSAKSLKGGSTKAHDVCILWRIRNANSEYLWLTSIAIQSWSDECGLLCMKIPKNEGMFGWWPWSCSIRYSSSISSIISCTDSRTFTATHLSTKKRTIST